MAGAAVTIAPSGKCGGRGGSECAFHAEVLSSAGPDVTGTHRQLIRLSAEAWLSTFVALPSHYGNCTRV